MKTQAVARLQETAATPVGYGQKVRSTVDLRKSMIVNGCTQEWRIETKKPLNVFGGPTIALGSWGWGANGDKKPPTRDIGEDIAFALKFLQRVYDFKSKTRKGSGGVFTFTQGDKVVKLIYSNLELPTKQKTIVLDRAKKVPAYAEIFYAPPEAE